LPPAPSPPTKKKVMLHCKSMWVSRLCQTGGCLGNHYLFLLQLEEKVYSWGENGLRILFLTIFIASASPQSLSVCSSLSQFSWTTLIPYCLDTSANQELQSCKAVWFYLCGAGFVVLFVLCMHTLSTFKGKVLAQKTYVQLFLLKSWTIQQNRSHISPEFNLLEQSDSCPLI
jgi:hypothetical protein